MKDARDLARTIGMLPPNTPVKLDILRQGEAKAVTVTLAQMPDEQTGQRRSPTTQSPSHGVPHLGLTVAPAAAVGAGQTASW